MGRGTAVLTITDQYRNMAEIIAGSMHLIRNAEKACEAAGVTPLILPIRGGTDGAQLSFKGLPARIWGPAVTDITDRMSTSRRKGWKRRAGSHWNW